LKNYHDFFNTEFAPTIHLWYFTECSLVAIYHIVKNYVTN